MCILKTVDDLKKEVQLRESFVKIFSEHNGQHLINEGLNRELPFDENEKDLPLEILLMLKLQNGGGNINIVELLDFFEISDSWVLILERPRVCQDLFDYIASNNYIDEETYRMFFRQVIIFKL